MSEQFWKAEESVCFSVKIVARQGFRVASFSLQRFARADWSEGQSEKFWEDEESVCFSVKILVWEGFRVEGLSIFELLPTKTAIIFCAFLAYDCRRKDTFVHSRLPFPNEYRDQITLLERPDSNRNITPPPIAQTDRGEIWAERSNSPPTHYQPPGEKVSLETPTHFLWKQIAS